MRKRTLLIIITIIAAGACGCGTEQNMAAPKKNNAYGELTERQKDILGEAGLPSDSRELTAAQEKSIKAIEEMLSYLENKYHKDFEYVGYTPAGNLEKETLRVCPSAGDPQTDSFEVKKNGDSYEDSYMLVAIRDDYAEYIETLLSSKLKTEKLKVFADIYTTDLSGIPENREDYDGAVSSWKAVFVYLPDKDEDTVSEYAREIEEALESRKLGYDCDIIFLKEDVANELTPYNYMDYLSSEYYTEKKTIKID